MRREFLDVVTRLWDGWEPGAVVADKATGVYADVARIHRADHEGEFFSVAGPLPVPPGPQGRPVVVQAGGSRGRAASWARGSPTWCSPWRRPGPGRSRSATTSGHEHVAAGRDPDQVKVSLGVVVLVGETEQDARDRVDELIATLPVDDLARGVLSALGLPDA